MTPRKARHLHTVTDHDARQTTICRATSKGLLLSVVHVGRGRVLRPAVHAVSRAGIHLLVARQDYGQAPDAGWHTFAIEELFDVALLYAPAGLAKLDAYPPLPRDFGFAHCAGGGIADLVGDIYADQRDGLHDGDRYGYSDGE